MGNVRTIDFHGDQLLGFEDEAGAFVALKPLVENMGPAWMGQHDRIRRDPILHEGIRVIRIPFARGGEQDALCLPVELIHGFLFRIDAGRIRKPDIREKVLAYQRDCYRVLSEAFSPQGRGRRQPQASTRMPWNEARKMVTETRHTYGEVAARQMWAKLGLPIVPAMLAPQPQPDLFDGPPPPGRH